MKEIKKDDERYLLQIINSNDQSVERIEKTIQEFSRVMLHYKCAIMEVETKLNVINEEFSLEHDRNPINTIKTRLKSPRSILEKMERKGYERSIESILCNMNDIAGIRVICSFYDDVYLIAEALLKQDDIRLISMKDYIKYPKKNGYRSLHLIVEIPIFFAKEKHFVKVEVQLRTIAMDFWASLEHQLRYKKDVVFNEEMANELSRCANESANLDLQMNNLRKGILNKK